MGDQSSGKTYYCNRHTRESSWTPPSQDSIELALRRYVRFVVDVELTGESLGLEFNNAFQVVAILVGLIKNTWNGSNIPSLDVSIGDTLVEVNGATSDLEKNLLDLKEN